MPLAAGKQPVARYIRAAENYPYLRGFDGPEGRTDSFGIVGMYERADAIGASLRIESSPGAGTTVTVEIAGEGKPALTAVWLGLLFI